jgi:DNA-binding IclR family transcriptional regulator
VRADFHGFKLEPLLDYLATLRVANVIRTEGEVDADVQGWGVAIHHGNVLMGSLSVVLARNAPDIASQRIATQLHRAALRIEGRLDAAH